jgi:hypothetical protein
MKGYLRKIPILMSILAISLMACKKKSINCGIDCGTQNEELLFQTGFENTVITRGEYQNETLSGTDPNFTNNSNWADFNDHKNIGYVELSYEDGANHQRKASIVNDPDNNSNSVLQYKLVEPHIKEGSKYKGRIQLAVHDNTCIKELYQTLKIKLHPDLVAFQNRSERLYWFTLFEFWNNGAWTKERYPFRVSVNLFKEEGAGKPLHFRVKSDYFKNRKWTEVWGQTATTFPIIFGEWLELELYIKEGDANNGRFFMSVTPENGTKTVLFDISNTTHHPKEKCADGFTHFELMKMYLGEDDINFMKNANKELVIFWDDWKLYANKKP